MLGTYVLLDLVKQISKLGNGNGAMFRRVGASVGSMLINPLTVFALAFPVCMQRYCIVIIICIPLMIDEIEHPFISL